MVRPRPLVEKTIRVMLLVLGHISTYDEIPLSNCKPIFDHYDPPVTERMRQCNLDEISEEARTHLQQLVDNEKFTQEIMQNKMTILGPCCAWLRLVNSYIIMSQ